MAALTERLLRSEGLEVRTVRSGREALEATTEFSPQLIVCDLNLPDIRGSEVVRRLRLDSANRRTYVVILTVLSKAELRAYNSAAKEMGVDEFIAKPLTPDTLRGVLAKLRPPQRVSPKRRPPSKVS